MVAVFIIWSRKLEKSQDTEENIRKSFESVVEKNRQKLNVGPTQGSF